MHRHPLPTILILIILFVIAAPVTAQDVVTIGTGNAPSGGAAAIPISLRDVSGTSLGTDAGTGNRIQGFAFKVMYPTDVVASVTFARGGVIASATPLFRHRCRGRAGHRSSSRSASRRTRSPST